MNKVIFSLSLIFFLAVGNLSNSFAYAPLKTNKEIASKGKEKKKKKKNCASKEEAETKSCCKKEGEKKSCEKK
jgi:hypothetical protein